MFRGDEAGQACSCARIGRILREQYSKWSTQEQFAEVVHTIRQLKLKSLCPCFLTHEFKYSEFHTCCGKKILTPHSQLLPNEENCRRNLSRVPVSRPRIAFPSVCRLQWLPCVLILRSKWFSLINLPFTHQGRRGEQAVLDRKGFGLPTSDSRPPSN